MGTTPTTPTIPTPTAPTAPTSQNWIEKWVALVKAHERLIIIAVAAFVLFRAGQGIENIILKHDAKAAESAATLVQQDTVSNKQLQDQLTSMKASADAQTAKLKADIQSQLASLAAQKKKDTSSTPAQIADRWEQLLPLRPGSITSVDPSTTGVTNDAANQTVQALEEIPVLKSQVVDLTLELTTTQGIVAQQDNTITGLNKQIVDEKLSHVAEVKLAKDRGKKSFWRGFKIGLVVGVVGTEAIRIWAGHP